MTGELENGMSASARTSRSRPFYSSWADVYDLLIADGVEPWVDTIHTEVTAQGPAAASILDAGCGTGRHAAALVALGHHLTLLDASPDLLAIAARRCPDARVRQEDLSSMRPTESYDAIICRGVLNDLITDEERQGALDGMSASLRRGGVLVLDVREREGSAARATGVPRTRTVDVWPKKMRLTPMVRGKSTATTTVSRRAHAACSRRRSRLAMIPAKAVALSVCPLGKLKLCSWGGHRVGQGRPGSADAGLAGHGERQGVQHRGDHQGQRCPAPPEQGEQDGGGGGITGIPIGPPMSV